MTEVPRSPVGAAESPSPDRAGGELVSIPIPDTLPQPGSSAITRTLRWVTGGPDARVYEFLQKLRRVGWWLLDVVDAVSGLLVPVAPPVPERTRVVRVAGRRMRALVWSDATPEKVRNRTIRVVNTALTDAGVNFFVLPDGPGRVRICIRVSDANRMLKALGSVVGQDPLHVGVSRRDRVFGVRRADHFRKSRMSGARALRVVVPAVDPHGYLLLAMDEAGVDLELWRELPGGVLGAPVRNRFTPYLKPESQISTTIVAGGMTLPTFEELAVPHVEDMPFPIDAVYTWVNANDTSWRSAMESHKSGVAGPHSRESVADARFTDYDELRFSLRSIAANAPWLNHVWLVTDSQVPSWLRDEHPGLTVVDHREIWVDQTQLPVFNSHAIEANLHRIGGLAEHYIYFNDDVMLGRSMSPEQFFTPGGVLRLYPSTAQVGAGGAATADGDPSAAAKNNRAVLLEATGAIQTQKLQHTPHAQVRSIAQDLELRFPADFARTSGSKFRSASNIAAISLVSWYAYRIGAGVPASLRYLYIRLGTRRTRRVLRRVLRRRDYDVFCVNQADDPVVGPDRIHRDLAHFFERYFPFKSPWEI